MKPSIFAQSLECCVLAPKPVLYPAWLIARPRGITKEEENQDQNSLLSMNAAIGHSQ
jgi:hypothetical protein